MALNHLRMCGKTYPGDFTYYKAEKKSQLDFVFTDRVGMKYVKDYTICNENWHLSDHRPLCLEIRATEAISCNAVLRRAKDLNYEFDPHHVKPETIQYNCNGLSSGKEPIQRQNQKLFIKTLTRTNIN